MTTSSQPRHYASTLRSPHGLTSRVGHDDRRRDGGRRERGEPRQTRPPPTALTQHRGARIPSIHTGHRTVPTGRAGTGTAQEPASNGIQRHPRGSRGSHGFQTGGGTSATGSAPTTQRNVPR